MKKATFLRLEVLWFMMSWASNFAHPVTPAFFNALHFSSSMFGISFAAMSVGYFLFSPLWGRLSDRHGAVPIMALSMVLYGLSQWAFGMITTPFMLIVVRIAGGAFTSGYAVIAMAYCANLGDGITRPRFLSIHGAISVAATSLGYLTGGYIGMVSIAWVFRLQALAMIATAVVTVLILSEIPGSLHIAPRATSPETKHTRWAPSLLFMLGSIVLASFAATGYENAFNYYLTDVLFFPTSYNGLIKALTGLVGFGANMLLNLYLARRGYGGRSLLFVLIACVASMGVVLIVPGVGLFIAANVIFTAFSAMVQPLQQAMVAQGQEGRMGAASGMFNSARSLGMVTGSLFAGFIYEAGVRLPFVFTMIAFAGACIVSFMDTLKGSVKK